MSHNKKKSSKDSLIDERYKSLQSTYPESSQDSRRTVSGRFSVVQVNEKQVRFAEDIASEQNDRHSPSTSSPSHSSLSVVTKPDRRYTLKRNEEYKRQKKEFKQEFKQRQEQIKAEDESKKKDKDKGCMI